MNAVSKKPSSKVVEFVIIILTISLSFISTTGITHATPSLQPQDGQVYVVQAGDWLNKLADNFYNDPLEWPIIWRATNNKFREDSSFTLITNPDLIKIGQKLWIPNADEVKQQLTISDKSKNKITGIYISQSEDHRYYNILRFYEDGLVLTVSVVTKDIVQSWPKINQWFHRDNANPNYSTGRYYSKGDHLSFSSISKFGTVDYAGDYFGDKLILSSYSHINNHKSENIEYIYLDVED